MIGNTLLKYETGNCNQDHICKNPDCFSINSTNKYFYYLRSFATKTHLNNWCVKVNVKENVNNWNKYKRMIEWCLRNTCLLQNPEYTLQKICVLLTLYIFFIKRKGKGSFIKPWNVNILPIFSHLAFIPQVFMVWLSVSYSFWNYFPTCIIIFFSFLK